ncbi:GNAT family N-acetyltransferase [Streptomyces sp. SP18CS02]|uniref:GNAT family N-acetyltransferase n=1 Tax=Streptomyces sp. SP18CS02 TaxID=3002531 RepID=UPI002E75A315|nr:GNAT family N-acetyltransferase [Streptomyces sp. SP18CS02]MEE1751670.1 GNAT family N-acetyltransferase [Streptomyces sp. SP18CS02]
MPPPIDAHASSGPGPEDTLDLELPDELIALFGADEPVTGAGRRTGGARDDGAAGDGPQGTREPALREAAGNGRRHGHGDLLDSLADWGPVTTPAGVLQLVPVRVERDLALISRWMNDPAVAAFWDLAGPEAVTAAHLNARLDGDGRSVPCLGVLAGVPMSYFELYRADLDPLARHYPARPHDTGVRILIGNVADRGRGLGGTLLRAVADLVLDNRPRCARVISEPGLRNTPSVAACLTAGFRFTAELDLPEGRAALMMRDRALRLLL